MLSIRRNAMQMYARASERQLLRLVEKSFVFKVKREASDPVSRPSDSREREYNVCERERLTDTRGVSNRDRQQKFLREMKAPTPGGFVPRRKIEA